MIVIVGNDKCSPCLKAKELLAESGVEWVERDRWDAEVREWFIRYRVRNIPAIFVGGEYLGSLGELEAYLKAK